MQSPRDFEWPHKQWPQLPAGQVEGQVSGREPDPVPWCDLRGLHAVEFGALMPRCQNQLIPQYALEGGEVSGGVEEWRSEFWAISAQGMNAAHSPGQSWQYDRRNLPTSWFTLHLPVTFGVKT